MRTLKLHFPDDALPTLGSVSKVEMAMFYTARPKA